MKSIKHVVPVESCCSVSEPIAKQIYHLDLTVTVPPPEQTTIKLEYITEVLFENYIKVQSVVLKCVKLNKWMLYNPQVAQRNFQK